MPKFPSVMGKGALPKKGEHVSLASYVGPKAATFSDLPDKFQGVIDQIPRAEIDDSMAKIMNQQQMMNSPSLALGSILNHPELYKQYPDLAQENITFLDNQPGYNGVAANSIGGRWSPQMGIQMPRPTAAQMSDPLWSTDFRAKLLDEIQHVISNKEGFAMTTPSTLAPTAQNTLQRPGEKEGYSTAFRSSLDAKTRKAIPPPSDMYAPLGAKLPQQTWYNTQQTDQMLGGNLKAALPFVGTPPVVSSIRSATLPSTAPAPSPQTIKTFSLPQQINALQSKIVPTPPPVVVQKPTTQAPTNSQGLTVQQMSQLAGRS